MPEEKDPLGLDLDLSALITEPAPAIEQIPSAIASQLEGDIARVDELCMMVAKITGAFDKDREEGVFSLNQFRANILLNPRLSGNDTAKELFSRAMDELTQADKQAQEIAQSVDAFLERSTITTEAYSTPPTISYSPQFPGVIIITLANDADAAQLDRDIEAPEIKKMRQMLGNYSDDIRSDSTSAYFGKHITDLTNIGFDNESNKFGILILNHEACQNADSDFSLEKITQHEYLHFIQKLIRKYLHFYFGRAGSKMKENYEHLEKVPENIRDQLRAAIGPLEKVSPKETTRETVDTLVEEQTLIDEMRAHGIAQGVIMPPKFQTTRLIFQPGITRRYADPKLAKRYFQLQLRMLSLWIRGGEPYKAGLAILAGSLSLAQASRLIEAIIDEHPINPTDAETQKKAAIIRRETQFIDYSFGDETLIDVQEVDKFIPKAA